MKNIGFFLKFRESLQITNLVVGLLFGALQEKPLSFMFLTHQFFFLWYWNMTWQLKSEFNFRLNISSSSIPIKNLHITFFFLKFLFMTLIYFKNLSVPWFALISSRLFFFPSQTFFSSKTPQYFPLRLLSTHSSLKIYIHPFQSSWLKKTLILTTDWFLKYRKLQLNSMSLIQNQFCIIFILKISHKHLH